MRVWLITHYYFPEIGAASVRLKRLAEALVALGHSVTVITGMPNYPEGVIKPPYRGRLTYRETIERVVIERVWVVPSSGNSTIRRLLNYITFAFFSALRATFLPRPDVLFVESHPLFVCLTGGWLKRVKRAPILLNVSDLWPESAIATGALSADSTFVKVAEHVERWAYHDAAHIVGLTQGVVEGIRKHAVDNVTLIQNAVDLDRFRPASADERAAARARWGIAADAFVAIHVGNMSLTYDFDILLTCARALPAVQFTFAGMGSQYERVRASAAGLSNVVFLGTVAHEQMPTIWACADVCLIALRDHSVAGGTLPAKLYEALATGTPVVASIRGEGAAMIADAGAGMTVAIGDAGAMIAALRALGAEASIRSAWSASARSFAEDRFQPSRVAGRYAALLQEVIA